MAVVSLFKILNEMSFAQSFAVLVQRFFNGVFEGASFVFYTNDAWFLVVDYLLAFTRKHSDVSFN